MPNPYYIPRKDPTETLLKTADLGLRLYGLKQAGQELSQRERHYQGQYGQGTPAIGTTPAVPKGTEVLRTEALQKGVEVEQARYQEDMVLNNNFGGSWPKIQTSFALKLGIKPQQLKKFAPRFFDYVDKLADDPGVANAEAHARIQQNLPFFKKELLENLSKESTNTKDWMPEQIAAFDAISDGIAVSSDDEIMGGLFPQVHNIIKSKEAAARQPVEIERLKLQEGKEAQGKEAAKNLQKEMSSHINSFIKEKIDFGEERTPENISKWRNEASTEFKAIKNNWEWVRNKRTGLEGWNTGGNEVINQYGQLIATKTSAAPATKTSPVKTKIPAKPLTDKEKQVWKAAKKSPALRTKEQQEMLKQASKEEVIALTNKLGIGADDLQATRKLYKDIGRWVWGNYSSFINDLLLGQ